MVLLQQTITTRSRSGTYKLKYHYIRRSHYNTQAGVPDQMYFLPESIGARNFKFLTDNEDINAMQAHVDYQSQDDYESMIYILKKFVSN